MRIKYSPQVSSDTLKYTFTGDIIRVAYKDKTDIFDFTNMPNGIAENIESKLGINPIISAKKEDGVLFVELLNFINENETKQEVLFPDWEVV